MIFFIFCKFCAESICQTINFSNFILGEHSGNCLNVIIEQYNIYIVIAIFLTFNKLFSNLISNSH